MVTTREEAVLAMAAIDTLIEARLAYAKERGWKVWTDTPLLVICINEATSLLDNAKSSETG